MVDVDQDASIGGRVCAWEGNAGWGGGAGTLDVHLVAGHVELGSSGRPSRVESDLLSSDQVVTGGEVGWDGEVLLSTVGVQGGL